MKTKPLILIIDDEESILQSLQEVLQDEEYQVETLSNPANALYCIGQLIPDLILLDISMPHCNGIDLLKKIKKEYPTQDVIMISGYGTIATALDAIKNGARDFIEKPLNLDEILTKLDYLKKSNSIILEKNDNNNLIEYGIIGESYLFLELISQLKKIAPLKLPLLLYGPHGSGRSLLAHFVYHQSSLPGDFITIDCSSELTEKDLDKCFEKPGTVYFKNIDQLSFSFQKKVLSRLNALDQSKIRVIASAIPHLYEQVNKQIFNASLFYKLNATPLEIPALNKRRHDIPLLIAHFCEEIKKQTNKKIIFPHSSIRILRNKNWPGNVLELKQCIEKISLLHLHDYSIITPEELRTYLSEKDVELVQEQTFTTFNSLDDARNHFERNFITYLLKKNNYNVDQVSDRLRIDITQLKSKLLELNIDFKI